MPKTLTAAAPASALTPRFHDTLGGVVALDGNIAGEFITIRSDGDITNLNLTNMPVPSVYYVTIYNAHATDPITLTLDPDDEITIGNSVPASLVAGESASFLLTNFPDA